MRGNFFDTRADILDEAQGGTCLPSHPLLAISTTKVVVVGQDAEYD
jgi:hypothetical protein